MESDTPQRNAPAGPDSDEGVDKVYELTDDSTLQSPASAAGSKRILLLDDDLDLAEMVRDVLSMEGYRVTHVPSGVEGMKEIMAADFDVILCDLLMPNLSGDMFFLAVKKIKPALCERFIFISGHQANPKWEAFIREAKALVLWKPFPMHDLMTTIEVVLSNRGNPGKFE